MEVRTIHVHSVLVKGKLRIVTARPSTSVFLHEYGFLTAKLNLRMTDEEGTEVKCSTRRAMGSNPTMIALARRGGFDSIA